MMRFLCGIILIGGSIVGCPLQQRGRGLGVLHAHCLPESHGKGLVAHDRLVARMEFGYVVGKPRLYPAIAPHDVPRCVVPEAAVHVAGEVVHHPTEEDLRLHGLPHAGERLSERLRSRTGVYRRAPRDLAPFGREHPAPGVLLPVVPAAVGLALQAVCAERQPAYHAPYAPRVGYPRRQLEGYERMVRYVAHLGGGERRAVVRPCAVEGLGVPHAVAGTVVEHARAGVRGVPYAPRAAVREVPLEPRSEVRRDLLAQADTPLGELHAEATVGGLCARAVVDPARLYGK